MKASGTTLKAARQAIGATAADVSKGNICDECSYREIAPNVEERSLKNANKKATTVVAASHWTLI